MFRSTLAVIVLVLFCFLAPLVKAQDCAPPPITANSKNYNIFSPEQEMVVGELTYQRAAKDWRLLRDQQLQAYVEAIGERIIKHLPQTGLKYRFYIIDIPDVNAFNIPGGYVFISRKLIAFSNNEDELAGVIAHELGHAAVRHGALDLSNAFKKVLNVTQLGDRKDVIDKYNLFIERQRTKSTSRSSSHEDDQQLEADRIGLFAMVAAGYDPTAFSTLFSRLTEASGKGGGWFSSIFGKSSPEDKRVREMIKAAQQMPPACKENRKAVATEHFLKWQADIVSARDTNRTEELPGLLWKKQLSPQLRSDISHLDFHPKGTMFLVQDDFNITVIQRNPLQVMFQIPAGKAREAAFTPDGEYIVFGTENLRLEKWSIAERKPVAVREVTLRRQCWESEFSPDGNYLACVSFDMTVTVVETQTGKKVFEKKEFYQLSIFEILRWLVSASRSDGQLKKPFFNLEFAPDSKMLVVSRSASYRFRITGSYYQIKSEDTALALDLNTMKTIGLGGDLKKVTRTPFLFLDNNRILGMSDQKVADGGVFSFPDGKRLSRFPLAAWTMRRTSNPDYVVVKPLSNSRMGIVDVKRGILAGGMDKADATMWEDTMIYESISGQVLVSQVGYSEEEKIFEIKKKEFVDIPVGSIGELSAADVSGNLGWLAASSDSRGAVWDLASGQRKMHVRGFRGMILADNGSAIGEFPKLWGETHNLAILNAPENTAQTLVELPEQGAQLYRQFLLSRRPLRVDKKEGDENVVFEDVDLSREVKFELKNLLDNKVIFSREFPKEAPRYFFDDFSGRLILYWTLGSEAGKARLKEDSALAAKAKQLGNKDDDYLMEVFDCFGGKVAGTLLLETGKGSFEIDAGFSEGDWLVLHDSENRVLAYSLSTGELRHRFFGSQAALNPVANQIAVENYPGELTLYDLTSGESQNRLLFKSGAVFVRFNTDGQRLFVMTGEQMAYAFDVKKLRESNATAKQ